MSALAVVAASSFNDPPDSAFTFPDYCALPCAPDTWIVENLIPAGGWLNIYGPPKEGKSFAALQLAADIAGGSSEWLGFPVLTHGPVLYLQLDTPRSLWRQRLLDIHTATGITFDGVVFTDKEVAPYPYDILDASRGCPQWLAELCKRLRPLVVILDTLRECHQGDENTSDQMQRVVSTIDKCIRPAACVVISHSRKENTALPPDQRDHVMDDNRGSGYVAGRMDAVVRIARGKLKYKGRTVDDHTLKLKRLPSHLWAVDTGEEEHHIRAVLARTDLTDMIQRAEALSALTGKTVEACRSQLRRRVVVG